MSVSHQAFVALGANIGDPITTLRSALAELAKMEDTRLVVASSLYRTAPVGLTNQPDFINAVAELETTLSAPNLLAALFKIEAEFGRIRKDRNGPRSLDLDLLLYDDLKLDTPQLTLPHPRLHLRAFVLAPLAEIAPDIALPGRGTLAAWLPAVANQAIARLP